VLFCVLDTLSIWKVHDCITFALYRYFFFWLGLINYAFVFMDVNLVFPPNQEHALRVPEKKVKRGLFSRKRWECATKWQACVMTRWISNVL